MPDYRSTKRSAGFHPRAWAVAVLLLGGGTASAAPVPLHDSVGLNIGLNCHWERRCIAAQTRAMNRALAFVRTKRPNQGLIHLCNRNASRGRARTDWIGFDNCIRHAR